MSIVCQGPATVNTPQDISFFHFAVNLREDRDYFKWTTFTTNKTFLTFPGTFTESKKNDKWAFVREELLYNFCAFTHTKNLTYSDKGQLFFKYLFLFFIYFKIFNIFSRVSVTKFLIPNLKK